MPTATTASPRPAAIISPAVDAICGGGLSLLVAIGVIAYSLYSDVDVDSYTLSIQLILLTDLLINWPHFMASYRLLYSRPQNFAKHPLVTIGLPILAVLFVGYVAFHSGDSGQDGSSKLPVIVALEWAAPVFLGWHYTGQSWGMTACHAFLGGLRMQPVERRLIRAGFYTLFVFHVVLIYDAMGFIDRLLPQEQAGHYLMQSLLAATRVAVFVSFALGLLGFQKLAKRESKSIPTQVWLPWLATYGWYVMVDFHPASFFLLQAFHALQYLTFPIRVELNQYAQTHRRKWLHMSVYYVLLIAFGVLAFGATLFADLTPSQMSIVTAVAIVFNLHHYFTDAVIWKIRDPQVREALFGHLKTS
ncbi:MAG: hypothetical protein R3C53_23915 [Pirellulaceae bacterium]